MSFRSLSSLISALALAALSALPGFAPAAQATTFNLAADGQWLAFGVDETSGPSDNSLAWIDNDYSNAPGFGTPARYDFTIGAGQVGRLTVVDADFAGDTFQVFNDGVLLGQTSAVPQGIYGQTADVGYDFDAALANASFSRVVYNLGEGSYRITGQLVQSVQLQSEGLNHNPVFTPLNATTGGISLSVTAVPEPSTAALVLAALAVTVFVSRRLSRSR
jgi:hypothetical protein